MAIRTKLGVRLVNESIRADDECLLAGEIIRIWALAEGQHEERLYWVTNLLEDSQGEIKSVLRANSKAHTSGRIQ